MDDIKLALLGSKEAAKRLTDAGVLVPCAGCGGENAKHMTLEQLREMDGEPVWFDTIKRWGIVKVCRDGVFVLTKSGEFEVGRCKYYRRPPEGEA